MKHAFLLWLSVYAGRSSLYAFHILDWTGREVIEYRTDCRLKYHASLSWSKLKQIKALELNSKLS